MAKRSRKHNPRWMVAKRAYSIREIAERYGIHVRTVQIWHKSGLMPLDSSERPLLFMGVEVQRYLREKQNSKKCKLLEHEFYCLCCKRPSTSAPCSIEIENTKKRVGRSDTSMIIKGRCVSCGCKLNKFITEKQLENSSWNQYLQADEDRLYHNSSPALSTDIEGVMNDESK